MGKSFARAISLLASLASFGCGDDTGVSSPADGSAAPPADAAAPVGPDPSEEDTGTGTTPDGGAPPMKEDASVRTPDAGSVPPSPDSGLQGDASVRRDAAVGVDASADSGLPPVPKEDSGTIDSIHSLGSSAHVQVDGDCLLYSAAPPAGSYRTTIAQDTSIVWAVDIATARSYAYSLNAPAEQRQWRTVGAPDLNGQAGEIAAVGTHLYVSTSDSVWPETTLHWFDGTAWEPLDDTIPLKDFAYADVQANAEGFYVLGTFGSVSHFDGTAFRAVREFCTVNGQSCAEDGLFSSLAVDGEQVYAVRNAAVSQLKDGAWTELTPPVPASLQSVVIADGQVLVLAEQGLFEVADGALHSVPLPEGCTTPQAIDAASAYVVLRCFGQLFMRNQGEWTEMPATATRPVLVSAEGHLIAADDPPTTLKEAVWQPVGTAYKPGHTLFGDPAGEVFTAGNDGILRVTPDGFEQFAGTEGWDVHAAWQSPDGSLFAGIRGKSRGASCEVNVDCLSSEVCADGIIGPECYPKAQIWRHSGDGWELEVDDAPGISTPRAFSNFTGRSHNDVWVGSECSVYHYNGENWASSAVPQCTPGLRRGSIHSIVEVSLAGEDDVLVNLDVVADSGLVFQGDGQSWTFVDYTQSACRGRSALRQMGPSAAGEMPTSFVQLTGGLEWRLNDAGWTQVSRLPSILAGETASDIIACGPTSYLQLDAAGNASSPWDTEFFSCDTACNDGKALIGTPAHFYSLEAFDSVVSCRLP